MLTIIIPTYNRYPRLQRLLQYLTSFENLFPIYVLDSSSDVTEAKGFFELLQNPRIVYTKYDSNITPIAKLRDVFERVQTPYVVLLGDDDFLVPDTLSRGVRFLEHHPDFSVVHGISGIFKVGRRDRKKLGVSPYPQRTIMDQRGGTRLLSHLGRYSTTSYSIHRTKNLARNIELCDKEQFGWQFAELFLGCLDVIQGKTQMLPALYMMREVHSGSDSWNTEDQQKRDFFDWVVGPDLNVYYPKFRDHLAGELQHVDHCSLSEAREIVKRAFWFYLSNALRRKLQQHCYPSEMAKMVRVKNMFKRIPGVRAGYQASCAWFARPETVTLPVLLSRRSPFHDDFMPIYKAITESAGA